MKRVAEPRKIVRRYTFRALTAVAAFQAATLLWGFLPPVVLQWLTLLVALLLGMLGIGGMRSVEKLKGVA